MEQRSKVITKDREAKGKHQNNTRESHTKPKEVGIISTKVENSKETFSSYYAPSMVVYGSTHMPLIPALGKLRQDWKFNPRLGYINRLSIKE